LIISLNFDRVSFLRAIRRNFGLILMKLGKIVITMRDRSCIVFEADQPHEELRGVIQFSEFLKRQDLTIYLAETRDRVLLKAL